VFIPSWSTLLNGFCHSLAQENILIFFCSDYLVTSWTVHFQSLIKQNYYTCYFSSVCVRSFSFPFLREITQIFSRGNVFPKFEACVFIVTCVNKLLRCSGYSFHYASPFLSWVGGLVITESRYCGMWRKLSLAEKNTVPREGLLICLT